MNAGESALELGAWVDSIDYVIDRARRRVLIRFIGEVDGRMLREAMRDYISDKATDDAEERTPE